MFRPLILANFCIWSEEGIQPYCLAYSDLVVSVPFVEENIPPLNGVGATVENILNIFVRVYFLDCQFYSVDLYFYSLASITLLRLL